VVEGTVFIGSLDGGVYAIRGENGSESVGPDRPPTGASESADRWSLSPVRDPTPVAVRTE